MNFLDSITTQAARDRLKALRQQRSDIHVALLIAGEQNEAEWIQTLGPGYDETLRSLLPPIPPPELRSITNSELEPVFLWQGTRDVLFLVDCYERHVQNRHAQPAVLDFGCGCGRITRLLAQSSIFKTFASDANPNHVAWCRENLTNITALKNAVDPPLDLPDGSINFAFAVSVFSHLPKERAVAWLRDLARVLSDHGILIVTTHGWRALSTLATSEPHRALFGFNHGDIRSLASQLSEEQFVFRPYDAGTLASANVGENYGSTFIDPHWMTEQTSSLFELSTIVAGGTFGNWQDAFVFRKTSPIA